MGMKRILAVSLIVLSAFPLFSRWSPYIALESHPSFEIADKAIDSYGKPRLAFAFMGSAAPLSLSFGNSNISVPLSFSYTTMTPVFERSFIEEHYDIGTAVLYSYSFGNGITLSAGPGFGFMLFPSTKGSKAYIGVDAAFTILINRFLSLSFPFRYRHSNGLDAIEAGLALALRMGASR